MDTIIKALALIGTVFLIGIVISIIIILGAKITGLVEEFTYQYQYKHRFDKPPIAACYCRDCNKWDPIDGKCSDHCNSRYMADCWFCCFAEPLTKNEAKDRDKQYETLNLFEKNRSRFVKN